MVKKIVLGALVLLGVAVGTLVVVLMVMSKPRPVGTPSAEADAMAAALMASVNADKWAETGAVRWTFAGRNRHLWDRARGLARVTSGSTVTWLRLADRTGVVQEGGAVVSGPAAEKQLERAWAAWVNDSFWMMGPAKLMDPGTTRALVTLEDGLKGLMVSYGEGGVTPGDAYVWIPGADGKPKEWRMWVKIIAVGGARSTWDAWQQLSTGPWVATRHTTQGLNSPPVDDLAGASTLAALEPGPDPFAPLLTAPAGTGASAASQPASQPASPPPEGQPQSQPAR
jgi:hypothetical protein